MPSQFCRPERLNNPDFRDQVLPKLAAATGLLVVDEAHCISDWGHDFRPDYRRLRTMLAELPAGVPVLATTATANARVTADVAEQLGTGAGTDALVLRGALDRESLSLSVLQLPDAATRLAWPADHLGELPGSGIIYTLTVAAAEEVTAYLRQCGHTVASYTGRTENADRQQAEEDLQANRVKALVATSALGMGFDFLRRQLDDEEAAPCGRCDNCAGARFSDKVSGAALDAARGQSFGQWSDPRGSGETAAQVWCEGSVSAGPGSSDVT